MNYSLSAKLMHWITGFMIIGMLFVGYLMSNLSPPQKFEVYNLHKSMGILLLFLAVVRLIMRIIITYPRLPEGTHRGIEIIAKINIFCLYTMMFLMPISGFLMSNLSGYSLSFFGFFSIPSFTENKLIAQLFYAIHKLGAVVLILLIITHIAGGLFHHFILKDNVLRRML